MSVVVKGWIAIKAELYRMAESMTTANGYNYDWTTVSSKDTKPLFIIEYPLSIEYPMTSPFEENVDSLGGINSFQYRNKRQAWFVGRIPNDPTGDNNDALDGALADMKHKFCGDISQELSKNGVKIVRYVQAVKRAVDPSLNLGSKYYPYELVGSFDIEYTEKRSI